MLLGIVAGSPPCPRKANKPISPNQQNRSALGGDSWKTIDGDHVLIVPLGGWYARLIGETVFSYPQHVRKEGRVATCEAASASLQPRAEIGQFHENAR
jgi:hypothetical protein